MVEQSEVVKGYEYERGQYFLVENQEIKKLAPDKGDTMEITEFVPLGDIDPVYYDASYFAVPGLFTAPLDSSNCFSLL